MIIVYKQNRFSVQSPILQQKLLSYFMAVIGQGYSGTVVYL